MRVLFSSFAIFVRNSRQIKPFVWINIRCVMLILISCLLVTQTYAEDIDWRMIKEINLNDHPIDIAISPDGSFIFILTANAVLVYGRVDDKIVNRIPVDKGFDKISFSKASNEFILTSTTSKTLNILKILPVSQINIDGLPYSGPENAPVTLIVFDDYSCSACAVLERVMKDVLQIYPAEVKLVVKHYPNTNHPFSEKAAAAARAAHSQGKFWEFHQALFEKQASLNDDTIQAIATQLSLDVTKFNQDLNSQKIKAMVDRDLSEGRQLGIKGTPTIFINGKYLEGKSAEAITDMIEAELNK